MLLLQKAIVEGSLSLVLLASKYHDIIHSSENPEEKEKYNIEGIATVFRNVMFGMALIIIIGYFIAKLTENPDIQNYAFWTSMIIGIPYLLIESNSKKHKKNTLP